MNGIDNLGSTIENNNKLFNDQTIENVSSNNKIELKRKNSPFMLISLTFHSLGIIFGDM